MAVVTLINNEAAKLTLDAKGVETTKIWWQAVMLISWNISVRQGSVNSHFPPVTTLEAGSFGRVEWRTCCTFGKRSWKWGIRSIHCTLCQIRLTYMHSLSSQSICYIIESYVLIFAYYVVTEIEGILQCATNSPEYHRETNRQNLPKCFSNFRSI